MRLIKLFIVLLPITYIFHKLYSFSSQNELIFDDSYMFIRYIEHIKSGGGFSWNYGEPSYGCTSITYTLFLVIFTTIITTFGNFSPESTLQFSAFCMFILSIVFLVASIFKTISNTWVLLLFVFLLSCMLFMPSIYYNIHNALDTMASMFALSWLSYCWLNYASNSDLKRLIFGIISSIVAFEIRPDNGIYALFIPTLTFFYIYHYKRDSLKTNHLKLFYSIFCFTLGIGLLLKWIYFGSPLPLSFYIKNNYYYSGYIMQHIWNPFIYLKIFIQEFVWILLLPLILFFNKKNTKQSLIFLLPLLVMVLYYFSVTQIMGNDARFYIPSLPILFCGVLVLCSNAEFEIKKLKSPILWLLIAITFLFPRLLQEVGYKIYKPYIQNKTMLEAEPYLEKIQYFEHKKHQTLDWNDAIYGVENILSQMNDSLIFAATEYGYLGAKFPRMKIFDLAGLHNKSVALNGFTENELKLNHPDFIWMPHFYYTGLYYQLTQCEYFKSNYIFYPFVLNYGVAILKTSRFKTQLERLIAPLQEEIVNK